MKIQSRLFRFLLAVFLGGALLVGLRFFSQPSNNTVDPQTLENHSLAALTLRGERLLVEVVNTPESTQQGLGGRASVTADGMLFLIDPPAQAVFWMKDMLMPIDIIWLRRGKIVGIERNVQPPSEDTPDSQLETYMAPQLVDMVLETAPGRVSTH